VGAYVGFYSVDHGRGALPRGGGVKPEDAFIEEGLGHAAKEGPCLAEGGGYLYVDVVVGVVGVGLCCFEVRFVASWLRGV